MIPPKHTPRAGYTLVEVLVATAVTSIVVGQMMTALIASQRLFEATLADAHLSLASRALREKVLYRINEDGGLMNASRSELEMQNKNQGWGNGVVFKPRKGKKNRIMLNSNMRLHADNGPAKWLESGTMELQSNKVFHDVISNAVIEVNLDLILPIRNRIYNQKHLVKSQIINE